MSSKRHVVREEYRLWGDSKLAGIDLVQEQGKGRAEEEFLDTVQDCFLIQLQIIP